jgi:hypothetical protein
MRRAIRMTEGAASGRRQAAGAHRATEAPALAAPLALRQLAQFLFGL